MPKYFAAPGSPFNEEQAEAIGPELEQLAESGAGSVVEIIEYARRNPGSALYGQLQMDRPVEESAEKWYAERARLCARSIMVNVVDNGQRHAVRAFYSVTVETDEPDSIGRSTSRYVTVSMVRNDADLSAQVIERARRELDSWTERYTEYRNVFGPVFKAIASL